jgi:hypothetical protein
MKVSLIDVDSRMPNLALMKISAYHKNKGDLVKWLDPLFDKPDIVYASKIFNFTPDFHYQINCEFIKGGTGYDIKKKLPNEIESQNPDYSIYPNCDYSIQFFSRGCIRKCPFCLVPQKEGGIQSVKAMQLNPVGKSIEVFDNNFFANHKWKNAIKLIRGCGQPVNLHGVDARILTKEHADALNSIKHSKQIHIAWDNPKINLLPKLKEITSWIKPYKLMCYVLIGFDSTPEEDLYRVMKIRELKIDPFVMPYDKANKYQNSFARWVNHKAVFKTVKWENYKK